MTKPRITPAERRVKNERTDIMGFFDKKNDAILNVRLARIEEKLDAILGSLEIELPDRSASPASAALDGGALEEIRSLIIANRKLEAVKRVRELTGLRLKEALDLVESGL
jgi:ribosomal protein L7/L12